MGMPAMTPAHTDCIQTFDSETISPTGRGADGSEPASDLCRSESEKAAAVPESSVVGVRSSGEGVALPSGFDGSAVVDGIAGWVVVVGLDGSAVVDGIAGWVVVVDGIAGWVVVVGMAGLLWSTGSQAGLLWWGMAGLLWWGMAGLLWWGVAGLLWWRVAGLLST